MDVNEDEDGVVMMAPRIVKMYNYTCRDTLDDRMALIKDVTGI